MHIARNLVACFFVDFCCCVFGCAAPSYLPSNHAYGTHTTSHQGAGIMRWTWASHWGEGVGLRHHLSMINEDSNALYASLNDANQCVMAWINVANVATTTNTIMASTFAIKMNVDWRKTYLYHPRHGAGWSPSAPSHVEGRLTLQQRNSKDNQHRGARDPSNIPTLATAHIQCAFCFRVCGERCSFLLRAGGCSHLIVSNGGV